MKRISTIFLSEKCDLEKKRGFRILERERKRERERERERAICSCQYIPYTLDLRKYLLQEMLELHFKYSAGALWENAPKQLSLMM